MKSFAQMVFIFALVSIYLDFAAAKVTCTVNATTVITFDGEYGTFNPFSSAPNYLLITEDPKDENTTVAVKNLRDYHQILLKINSYGYEIIINKVKLGVEVNGKPVGLPYDIPGQILIYSFSGTIRVDVLTSTIADPRLQVDFLDHRIGFGFEELRRFVITADDDFITSKGVCGGDGVTTSLVNVGIGVNLEKLQPQTD